jgi:flagellar basal body-associated protein FliL
MEGGIAIILLLIIVVVAAGIGIALYLTGGALWAGKTSAKGDRIEGGPNRYHRPEHKEASSPTTESTEVVGAEEAAEERSR